MAEDVQQANKWKEGQSNQNFPFSMTTDSDINFVFFKALIFPSKSTCGISFNNAHWVVLMNNGLYDISILLGDAYFGFLHLAIVTCCRI